jgi:hypothetical protein
VVVPSESRCRGCGSAARVGRSRLRVRRAFRAGVAKAGLRVLAFGVNRYSSMSIGISCERFCVRTVSHTPSIPGKHRGHVDVYRCCVKSLIGSALVGFVVCQHARRKSISKRARSTTPPSLSFRINDLRASGRARNAEL